MEQAKAMKSYEYKRGVTLVEILVVMAIIALLATMVISIAARIDNQSKERCLECTCALLESALQEYREYTGKFPEQPEKNFTNVPIHSEYLYKELHLIPESRKILEKIADSLLKNEYGATDTLAEIYDPWGTVLDYRYVAGDNFPDLISAGPDKIFGTADDISNR
jgi:prepilin-type N-terminal cleavage/methylation domain-containing protein